MSYTEYRNMNTHYRIRPRRVKWHTKANYADIHPYTKEWMQRKKWGTALLNKSLKEGF
jgi:hypothetical protein